LVSGTFRGQLYGNTQINKTSFFAVPAIFGGDSLAAEDLEKRGLGEGETARLKAGR